MHSNQGSEVSAILLSKKSVAAMLSVCVRTVDYLIARGELKPVRRIGKKVLIPRSSVEALARRNVPGPLADKACHDHQTQQEQKGNENAGQSSSVQPQS